MVKLSFCIPTYNRPAQLRRLLVQLKPQLTDQVEVLIRDDSSNDESKKVVKRILPSARYVHGKKLGLDMANMWLLEHAKGEWMWYFSDDDELQEGAIKNVMTKLSFYPGIDFMWANFTYGVKRVLAVKERDRFFRDGNEPFEILGTNIGLLSTFILKREKGLKYLKLGKKRAKGLAFASLVPIFGTLSEGGDFFLMGTPYVHCNPLGVDEIKKITTKGGVIKNDNFDTFGLNFYETTHLFKFSRYALRKITKASFGQLWRGMLVGWVGGWDTPEGKRIKMFKLYWPYLECWVALPLLCLPLGVIKWLFMVYKMFFNERKFKWKI